MNAPQPLTFAALDGLAFAAERGRLDLGHKLPLFSANALGPLLEWSELGGEGLLPFPEKAPWLSLDGSTPFVAALRSGRQQWVCPATRATGVFRTPTSFPEVETKWVSFGLAAQKAAIAAGFDRKIAAQFVGAMGEMVSNIYEHSGAHGSGIVAFKASSGAFEFVVMDRGIGVLQSLRSCVDYEHVTDHGMALQLALKDGISRFGPTANRGHGFRPIFVGLANLNGSLRFRSGDHALVIEGQRIDAMFAKTAQKARLTGFFASVLCRLPLARRCETDPRTDWRRGAGS